MVSGLSPHTGCLQYLLIPSSVALKVKKLSVPLTASRLLGDMPGLRLPLEWVHPSHMMEVAADEQNSPIRAGAPHVGTPRSSVPLCARGFRSPLLLSFCRTHRPPCLQTEGLGPTSTTFAFTPPGLSSNVGQKADRQPTGFVRERARSWPQTLVEGDVLRACAGTCGRAPAGTEHGGRGRPSF